jgi:predicted NACHT family NTPase
MPNQSYDWKRFWCPRTGNLRWDYGGYLADPESEYGRYTNPEVVPFESIAEIPCLALLGEPGIGKSTAIKQAFDQVAATEEVCLWFDLGEYSEVDLCSEVFRNDTFQAWLKGIQRLHLFLDSLDEGRLAIPNVAKILGRELKKCPCDRLYLRIACRTADWSISLEETLKQLWDENLVEVYELAPLRQVDIIKAAQANNLGPDKFLNEIRDKEVVPLAIKPVTLKFLLDTYSRDKQFPSIQKDLYFQGCGWLCKENNKDRRDAKLTGNLTAVQRMAVAARIAAITIFGNRVAILSDRDYSDVPDKDVTVQELCGSKENIDGNEFQVGENEIEEVLGTGLFSSRGLHRMGWAHQTYAEFLAAWYLEQHQMTIAQIKSLIVHSDDLNGKLVPQLHETAAWLAGMMPDVFREIMKADPDVLLRSDVATANVKDREALVENLLKLYDEGKLLNRYLDNYRRYRKLAHPGLVEQLRLYIRDLNKGFEARYVAIDIAEACELQALQDDLADVALDSSQPLEIRFNAASAICRIGNDAGKARLKPLAIGEAGDDAEVGLKHIALQAVWPANITTEEFFAALTSPKNRYRGVVLGDFVQHLQPADLPVALTWIEKQNPLQPSFEKLVDAILLKAWEHLESPGVLEALAKLAWSQLRHCDEIMAGCHDSLFKSALSNDDEKRRRVLEAMLPMISNLENDLSLLADTSTPMVLGQDVPWLIERLQASNSEQVQRIWTQLIGCLFNSNEPGHVDAVLVASKSHSILAEAFAWLLQPIDLYSLQAQKMKSDYLERQKRRERYQKQKQPLLEPPPAERIILLLDNFEFGNLAAWWDIHTQLMLRPDGTYDSHISQPDLTVLPGWNTAKDKTRARLVEAAKRYVLEQEPEADSLGSSARYESDLLGYKALRLLWQEAPGFVSTMSIDVWKKWAPFILDYSPSSGTEEGEPDYHLLRMAYQQAPTEIINTLILLIDEENENYNEVFITRKLKACWDSRLENALLTKVKDEKLKLKSVGSLLGELLEHKVKEAEIFAKSLVGLPPPFSGYRRSKAIVAAWTLIKHAEDAGWSVVWLAIQRDYKFGRKVVETVSYSDRQAVNVGQALSDSQLANLYTWLVQQYSYAEDPKHEGVYSPGSRDNIAQWRDSVLRHLRERGTPQACEEIQEIINKLPELDWLKKVLLEAQTLVRRRTWVSPQPSEILKLVSNNRVRLVQGGDQLLDVLVESLERLDKKLQDETPAAIFLWDQVVSRPKDENALSNYVKLHLEEDLKQRGIIVNREVEIRARQGSKDVAAPGERTDIQVDAVVRKPNTEVYDSATVIIEVKGCWNDELDDAMESQLVKRYLKDNSCQHGLYLVGWFNCNHWNSKDPRKRKAPKLSLEEARERFRVQAIELSQEGVKVRAVVLNTALR